MVEQEQSANANSLTLAPSLGRRKLDWQCTTIGLLSPLLSLILAFITIRLVLFLTDKNPFTVYGEMY